MASATPQELQREIMIPQLSHTAGPLPPELLLSVFHFLYLDDNIRRRSMGDGSHKLLNLMLVCQFFNRIIQTTSSLWTELRLVQTSRNARTRETDWIKWIENCITKSAEHPLRVFLILSFMPLSKIFPILLPTSPRWVHLTITSLSPKPINCPRHLRPLFAAPIPQLLSLSVKGLGQQMDGMSGFGTVFRHAPRLVQLEWHDRFVLFRSDDGETGAVEEDVHVRFVQGATYDFTQNTLEVLRIEGVLLVHVPSERMVMHRLRFLYLGRFCRIWSFLEKWQLPVLDELHLSDDPCTQVVGWASPTLPALKRLEWLDVKRRPNSGNTWGDGLLLLNVLAASPKLQYFSISTRNPCKLPYLATRRTQEQLTNRISPFLATDDATGAPKYCPDLQELRLQEADVDELERLVEIRPQLKKVEVEALRRNPISPSPLHKDLARLERVRERMEVCFPEWVGVSS